MEPDGGASRGDARDEAADVRSEMRSGFARVEREITALRSEMRAGFDRLDGRIDSLQVTLIRIGGGVIVGLVGVIAAVFARGV
jgi:hypothetical protein